MNNIEIENVFFSYGGEKSVLKGINLSVKPNEIVGLLGSNGSGKTTTFRLLSGMLQPEEGNIKICGLSLRTQARQAMKRCAFIPDEPLLYPNFSALENMNLFAMLWGVEPSFAKSHTEKMLNEVGLWDVRNQWVRAYSRGMKQKLSMCAGLLHEPKVLLMDEPFTGLDIDALIWAKEMLKRYVANENRSIIFTSHTPEVVESLATRVVILKEGKILHDQLLNINATGDAPLVETYQKVVLGAC